MGTLTPFTPDARTRELLADAAEEVGRVTDGRIGDLVGRALLATLTETVGVDPAGRVFVITGDIPAMWLRDSTTQLTPYLRFVEQSGQLADLVNDTDRAVSLPVPLYGRRHELGLRPRRRSVLAVERVEVAARSTAAVAFSLGLDGLGSWADGRPVPAPAEVVAWTAPSHDPPSDALVVRITDEEGDTGWGH